MDSIPEFVVWSFVVTLWKFSSLHRFEITIYFSTNIFQIQFFGTRIGEYFENILRKLWNVSDTYIFPETVKKKVFTMKIFKYFSNVIYTRIWGWFVAISNHSWNLLFWGCQHIFQMKYSSEFTILRIFCTTLENYFQQWYCMKLHVKCFNKVLQIQLEYLKRSHKISSRNRIWILVTSNKICQCTISIR